MFKVLMPQTFNANKAPKLTPISALTDDPRKALDFEPSL